MPRGHLVLTRLKGPLKNEFRLTISTTDLVIHRALLILLFLGGKIRFRSKIVLNFSRCVILNTKNVFVRVFVLLVHYLSITCPAFLDADREC